MCNKNAYMLRSQPRTRINNMWYSAAVYNLRQYFTIANNIVLSIIDLHAGKANSKKCVSKNTYENTYALTKFHYFYYRNKHYQTVNSK